MRVLFVAGFGPIAREPGEAKRFYGDALGIALSGDEDYPTTEDLPGVKHFGLWPLTGAAQSCFGTTVWPADVPVPQGWIEFDVDDVAAASRELESKGYRVLVGPRTEPWGQTVARLLGPEGLLVGITVTPWLREPAR
ncbi:glyoxalase/bleomycin resistance/dioxygenase family protein [soil metagenome]